MGARSGHITNLKQSILETFDIYGGNTCFIYSFYREEPTQRSTFQEVPSRVGLVLTRKYKTRLDEHHKGKRSSLFWAFISDEETNFHSMDTCAKWMEPWKDLESMWGVPGAEAAYPPLGYPLLEISATDLALRTVVAPEIIDGGTDDGPIERAVWGPMP